MEEWRPVPGFKGHYEVSNLGRVRSLKRKSGPHILKGCIHPTEGHMTHVLCLEGAPMSFTAARLVCLAWHGPALGRKITRITPDPENDTPENIRWADV